MGRGVIRYTPHLVVQVQQLREEQQEAQAPPVLLKEGGMLGHHSKVHWGMGGVGVIVIESGSDKK